MTAFFMMIGVAVLYAFCNIKDKQAISDYNLSGNEFSFFLAAPISLFLLPVLAFQSTYFTLSWQSFLAVALLTVQRFIEFQTAALILKVISAFELKAWLGLTLIISYFTDLLFDASFNLLKLLCLAAMISGLTLIVKSEKKVKVNYKSIILPLIIYIISKYGYGVIIKGFAPHVSSTLLMVLAHLLIALLLLPFLNFKKLFKEKRKGIVIVTLARIPNTAALLLESAVVMVSLVSYSFIQPLVLITLFLVDIIKKEPYSRLNLFGSIICILSFIAFQLI